MASQSRAGGFLSLHLSSHDRASSLLRATAELFVQSFRHDRDEIRRFEELAGQFLPQAGREDRIAVASLLAEAADVPTSTLVLLARDEIAVATPILERSTALGPLDLLTIVATTGPDHHRLIAGRPNLPKEIVTALQLTGDAETLAILDPAAAPDRTEAEAADTKAASPADAANAPDRPADADRMAGLDARTFLGWDRGRRLAMLAELSERRVGPPQRTPRRQIEAAIQAAYQGAQVAALARGGRRTDLVSAFALGLGLAPELASDIIADRSGEALVVMIRALGISDADARELLLLANPEIGRDGAAFFRLADLYAGLERSVAEAVIAAWSGEARPGEAHQPHYIDASGVHRLAARRQLPALAKPAERQERAG